MRLKLLQTEDVLEGVVTEDYVKVEKGASDLMEICKQVGWTPEKTKGKFEMYDVRFHNIARELKALAKMENYEGMVMKYRQLLDTCIDCHQHVRDVEAPEEYPAGIHEGEFLYEGKHIHSR